MTATAKWAALISDLDALGADPRSRRYTTEYHRPIIEAAIREATRRGDELDHAHLVELLRADIEKERQVATEAEAKVAALREGVRLAQVEVSEAAWSLGREHELFDRLIMAVTRLAALADSER